MTQTAESTGNRDTAGHRDTGHRDHTSYRAYWMTLDPVHVGSGGYRLGRVDLPVVREPGTNLPKIPGTSLSGAARAYSALQQWGSPADLRCAGQRKHCGKCQVCATFGAMYEGNGKQEARAGMANIFDAQLLFFPVFSMRGPVWVTTSAILAEAGFGTITGPAAPGKVLFTGAKAPMKLNLGWLLFDAESTPGMTAPAVASTKFQAIKDRIVIVDDSVFSHVVNSNLEVRTSVAIDAETGAAKEGALFTYEAIPRAAWLHQPVVFHRFRAFPAKDETKARNWERIEDVVQDGLRMAASYGVGGMGTRGFGRMELLGGLTAEGGQQ